MSLMTFLFFSKFSNLPSRIIVNISFFQLPCFRSSYSSDYLEPVLRNPSSKVERREQAQSHVSAVPYQRIVERSRRTLLRFQHKFQGLLWFH